MDKTSTDALSERLLDNARDGEAGRAAETLYGGHDRVLRQTAIALLAGREMSEHESPGEATLQVLRGQVTVHADGQALEAVTGEIMEIPPVRHSLSATVDSVVLLTVAKTSPLGV